MRTYLFVTISALLFTLTQASFGKQASLDIAEITERAEKLLIRTSSIENEEIKAKKARDILQYQLTPYLNDPALSSNDAGKIWRLAALATHYSQDKTNIPLVVTMTKQTNHSFDSDPLLQNVIKELESSGITYWESEVLADRDSFIALMRHSATSDSTVLFDIANCFEHGKGAIVDKAESAVWYQQAADNGNIDAAFQLATLLHYGDGLPKDPKRAKQLYTIAAEAKHVESMYRLGLLFIEATIRNNQSTQIAIDWFEKAATFNHAPSMYQLGRLYDKGGTAAQSYEIAAGWYQRAADIGDPDAMFMLGIMYQDGRGVPKLQSVADDWFSRARVRAIRVGRPLASQITFFDCKIDAPKVVFICDVSDSMTTRNKSEMLNAELINTIQNLQPEIGYAVYWFDDWGSRIIKPLEWTSTDQFSSRRIASKIQQGAKDLFSFETSFDSAFNMDPLPNAIILSTDGGLARDAIERIEAVSISHNVPVYCFSIGSSNSDRDLELLALESGGTFTKVRVP